MVIPSKKYDSNWDKTLFTDRYRVILIPVILLGNRIYYSAQPIIICPVILWMEEVLHQLIDGLSHYLKSFNHCFSGAPFRNHQHMVGLLLTNINNHMK